MTYLLIIILTTASGTERTVRPMPDAQQCDAAMEAAKVEIAKLPPPWSFKVRCDMAQGKDV